MAKISVELSEAEMKNLAEMSAMILTMLGQVADDLPSQKVDAWQHLCVQLLQAAHTVPSIARDLELNPDCGYWFFKRPYLEEAFFSDMLDEYRESTFWEELVARLAQQCLEENLGRDAVEMMGAEERRERTSSLEKALWHEVTRYGLERMVFMLPDREL